MKFIQNADGSYSMTFDAAELTVPVAAPTPTPSPAPTPTSGSTPTSSPAPSPVVVQGVSAGTANTACVAYSGGWPAGYIEMVAKRHGVMIASPVHVDAAAVKAANPGIALLQYINTSNVSKGDDMDQYATKVGFNPRLLAASPSVQQINSTYNIAQGEPFLYYDDQTVPRNFTDFTDAAHRDFLANFISQALSGGWDGFFEDNSDRGGGGEAGKLVSGTAGVGLTGPCDLSSGQFQEINFNALKSQIDAALAANIRHVCNVGTYDEGDIGGYGWYRTTITVNGMTLPKAVPVGYTFRGNLQEYYYRISTLRGDIENNYLGMSSIYNAQGKPANRIDVMWWIGNDQGSGIGNGNARIKMVALATHLAYQYGAAFLHYDNAQTNDDPLNNDWFPAMGVDLGAPLEDPFTVDANTVRRKYQKGIVLVRMRLHSADNYTDSATYDLGGTYKPLHADGTLDAAASQAVLRNGEALVGLL